MSDVSSDSNSLLLWHTLLVRAGAAYNYRAVRDKFRNCFEALTLNFERGENCCLHVICASTEVSGVFMSFSEAVRREAAAFLNSSNLALSVEVISKEEHKEFADRIRMQKKMLSGSNDRALKQFIDEEEQGDELPLFSAVPDEQLYSDSAESELPLFSNAASVLNKPVLSDPDFSGEPEYVASETDLLEEYKKRRVNKNEAERTAMLQEIKRKLTCYVQECEAYSDKYMSYFASAADERQRRIYSDRLNNLNKIVEFYRKQIDRCEVQINAVSRTAQEMQRKGPDQGDCMPVHDLPPVPADPNMPLLGSVAAPPDKQDISVGMLADQRRKESVQRADPYVVQGLNSATDMMSQIRQMQNMQTMTQIPPQMPQFAQMQQRAMPDSSFNISDIQHNSEFNRALADSLGIDYELLRRKMAEVQRVRSDSAVSQSLYDYSADNRSYMQQSAAAQMQLMQQNALHMHLQHPNFGAMYNTGVVQNAASLGQGQFLSPMQHQSRDDFTAEKHNSQNELQSEEDILSAAVENSDLSPPANSRLMRNKTFSNYVPDPENRMLVSAALSIAQNPGNSNYNPFYIYGGSGLGKTHLLCAVANKIMQDLPHIRVNYTSAEDFIYRYVMSVRQGGKGFKKGKSYYDDYRSSQVVIIDDIQNFSKAEKSRNAFFEIIAEFLDKPDCQLILASDVAPASLSSKGFNTRLTSRFGSGVCCEVMPPSKDTRIKIITNKCAELNIELMSSLIEYMAANICSNVREIEGAIKTLHSFIRTAGRLDPDMAMKALSSFVSKRSDVQTDEMSISVIKELTARHFEISVSDLESGSKKKQVTIARAMAMTLCKDMVYGVTLADIGRAFNKDHSSVSEAIRRIRMRLPEDRDLSLSFNQLVNTLNRGESAFTGNPELEGDLKASNRYGLK